jgi:hypothetical protein
MYVLVTCLMAIGGARHGFANSCDKKCDFHTNPGAKGLDY